MNEATWTPLLVAALAVLIAAFAFVKAHRAAPNGLPTLTPADVLAEVRAAQPLAGELAEVALTATQAAEQLYRTGQIAKTERLDRAVAYVQAWFPQLDVRLIEVARSVVARDETNEASRLLRSQPDSDM